MDRDAMLIVHVLGSSKLAEEIGLTPDQVTELKNAIFALREQQVEVRASIEKAGLEQARLLTESTVDEEALMAAVAKAGAARTEQAKLRMRQLLLVKRSLTPDQVGKAKELSRDWLAKRRAAHHKEKARLKEEVGERRGRAARQKPQAE